MKCQLQNACCHRPDESKAYAEEAQVATTNPTPMAEIVVVLVKAAVLAALCWAFL